MRSLAEDLASSFRNPGFWALSSWLDIVVRYRQSRLGVFWLLAPAIVYIWGLGSFFASMQGIQLSQFAAFVAIGYSLFRIINSVIIESTTAFSAAAPFIMDGHARLTDFVLRVMAKALFYFLVSLPVVAAALAIFPGLQWGGLLLCMLSLPLVLLNILWISVIFSLVGARFPDMSQFIGNVFMFAFLFTPIIWRVESMPIHSLRGTLVRMNPMFHMIEIVRGPIMGDRVEPVTFYYIGAMTIVGWILAAIAYRRYARYVPIWI